MGMDGEWIDLVSSRLDRSLTLTTFSLSRVLEGETLLPPKMSAKSQPLQIRNITTSPTHSPLMGFSSYQACLGLTPRPGGAKRPRDPVHRFLQLTPLLDSPDASTACSQRHDPQGDACGILMRSLWDSWVHLLHTAMVILPRHADIELSQERPHY